MLTVTSINLNKADKDAYGGQKRLVKPSSSCCKTVCSSGAEGLQFVNDQAGYPSRLRGGGAHWVINWKALS